MIKSNGILTLVFLLFLSCSKQNKSSRSTSLKTDNSNPLKLHAGQLKAPRVDSILQFTSMITAMLEDSKGNFWFGTHHEGLCLYNPRAKTMPFTYLTVDQGLPNFNIQEFDERQVHMGNSIRTIEEDAHGNIWFCTGDGISKFDPLVYEKGGQAFTTIPLQGENMIITESFIYEGDDAPEKWEKEFNKLWFREVDQNGTFRYDGEKLMRLTFPAIDLERFRSQYASYSLYKDRNKNIWFGTESGGIFKYNGKSFTCINEKQKKGIVRAFFQDKSDRVWISNVLYGLHYYENDSLYNFTQEQGMYGLSYVRNNPTADDSKTLDGIQSIEQDKHGNLWFGTFSDGLWRYDGAELTHFTKENKTIPSNTVKTIYKDKSGNLWFGIGEGTIYSFNGTSFIRFDTKI